jgi:tetratricopeptide (TPR) repeat protein
MTQQLLAQATALHGAGDLIRAEALYRHILALAPDHPDALHLLGRLALQAGNAPSAQDLIARAVRVRPRIAEYQASLAEVQRALGRQAEAVETLRRAVRLKPESALIQYGHGMALYETGQSALAMQALRRAIARDPTLHAAHRALGALLIADGQPGAAVESYRAALRLSANDPEDAFNLGYALQQSGDLAGAETQFRDAVARRPDYLQAVNNLGVLLQSAGRLDEAAAWLRRACAIAPDAARGFSNLGLVLRDMSDFAGAEAAFRQAEAISPSAETLCCIGNTLRDQGRLAESETALQAALARDPAHGESHIGMAFTYLLGGDLARGWPHFAWRGAAAIGRARIAAHTAAPAWDGGELDGTLLIYAEQGAGDFIQMARFVAMARARAARVVLQVPASLQRLAHGLADGVFTLTQELPPLQAVCADLDLAAVFATDAANIPTRIPYLAAPPEEVEAWRQRVAALPGRRIGLAWAGNPAYAADRQRSVPPHILAGLANIDGVSFVSLQPGMPAPFAMTDWTAELQNFAATAALIDALDLVISVDSAVAHLAGAMGRPVWLLNRYAPDWRWGLQRGDSAWYPTLRQFRQSETGEWGSVLGEVRKALSFL